jgi:hypothetical protein
MAYTFGCRLCTLQTLYSKSTLSSPVLHIMGLDDVCRRTGRLTPVFRIIEFSFLLHANSTTRIASVFRLSSPVRRYNDRSLQFQFLFLQKITQLLVTVQHSTIHALDFTMRLLSVTGERRRGLVEFNAMQLNSSISIEHFVVDASSSLCHPEHQLPSSGTSTSTDSLCRSSNSDVKSDLQRFAARHNRQPVSSSETFGCFDIYLCSACVWSRWRLTYMSACGQRGVILLTFSAIKIFFWGLRQAFQGCTAAP